MYRRKDGEKLCQLLYLQRCFSRCHVLDFAQVIIVIVVLFFAVALLWVLTDVGIRLHYCCLCRSCLLPNCSPQSSWADEADVLLGYRYADSVEWMAAAEEENWAVGGDVWAPSAIARLFLLWRKGSCLPGGLQTPSNVVVAVPLVAQWEEDVLHDELTEQVWQNPPRDLLSLAKKPWLLLRCQWICTDLLNFSK